MLISEKFRARERLLYNKLIRRTPGGAASCAPESQPRAKNGVRRSFYIKLHLLPAATAGRKNPREQTRRTLQGKNSPANFRRARGPSCT